jgi:hypothetical protein
MPILYRMAKRSQPWTGSGMPVGARGGKAVENLGGLHGRSGLAPRQCRNRPGAATTVAPTTHWC